MLFAGKVTPDPEKQPDADAQAEQATLLAATISSLGTSRYALRVQAAVNKELEVDTYIYIYN